MHVTRTHHRRVVAIMSGVILLLIIGIGTLALRTGPATTHTANDAGTTTYLAAEEAVVMSTTSEEAEMLPIEPTGVQYVEVVDSCNHAYSGDTPCVQAYAGPGTGFESVQRLREGIVLTVAGEVENEGTTWYKITFDEWLRYPERITSDWYVPADGVEVLYQEGVLTTWDDEVATTSKRIIVDRSEQRLYAYEGEELFLETPISTGLALTPTPSGTFTVFKKMPSRYMQGPIEDIPESDYYDLPGVPWNLYFTEGGAVIHGTYWHESFGSRYSHGCVNVHPDTAQELYNWAPLGTTVVVRD